MTPIKQHHQKHASMLGKPINEVVSCHDKLGKLQEYERGFIYWHPDTGAKEIHGGILEIWNSMGGIHSFLGYPIRDEENCGGNFIYPTRSAIGFF